MSCDSNVSKFLPIVREFLIRDPNKYRKFDNIAERLNNVSASPLNKALALHRIAIIYSELASIKPDFYFPGKAKEIVALQDLLDNPEMFLKEARDIIALKEHSDVTIESIEEQIDKLSVSVVIPMYQLGSIMKNITVLSSSYNYRTEEHRRAVVSRLIDLAENALKGYMHDVTPLIEIIQDTRSILLNKSQYIPLSQFDILKTKILWLKNGQKVEAYYDPETNTYEAVNGEPMDSPIKYEKDALNRPSGRNNTIEKVFEIAEIEGGYSFSPMGKGYNAESVILEKGESVANSGIKIIVNQVGIVSDARVARIQSLAKGENASLANRMHETFESEAQIQYLMASNEHREIVTFSRPKHGSPGIIGIVVDKEGVEHVFNLFDLENLTFVDNRNHTEKVNFNDPDHIERLKKASRKRVGNELVPLTDVEIKKLIQTYNNQKLFKKKALEQLSKNRSANITNLFREFFEFRTYQHTQKATNETLADAISENKLYAQEYEVITFDDKGEELKKETRRIPFIVHRDVAQTAENLGEIAELSDTGWNLVEMLGKNERVLYNGKMYKLYDLFHQIFTPKQISNWIQKNPTGNYSILAKVDNNLYSNLLEFQGKSTSIEQTKIFLNDLATLFHEFKGKTAQEKKDMLAQFRKDFGISHWGKKAFGQGATYFNYVNVEGRDLIEVRFKGLNARTQAIDFSIYIDEKLASESPEDFTKDLTNLTVEEAHEFIASNPEAGEALLQALYNKPEYLHLLVSESDRKNSKYNLRLQVNKLNAKDPSLYNIKARLVPKIAVLPLNKSSVSKSNGIVTKPTDTITKDNGELATPVIKKEEPETEEELPDIRTDEDSAFLLHEDVSDNYEEPYSEERLQSEKEWLRTRLPQFGIAEEDVEDLLDQLKVDGSVLGFFRSKLIYLNSKLAVKGTVYHEAFHGVFRMLLNNENRKKYTDQGIGNKKYSKLFTKEAIKEFASRRNLVKSEAELKQQIAEEILAEGFREHMLKKQAKGFIAKLYQLIQKLISLFKDNSFRLYERIDRGFYKKSIATGKTDPAFMLLRTRGRRYQVDNNRYAVDAAYLSVSEQNKLAYRLAWEIVHGNQNPEGSKNLSQREMFDLHRQNLIGTTGDYNIETLIARYPNKEKEIVAKYGTLYDDIKAILSYGISDEPILYAMSEGSKSKPKELTELDKSYLEESVDTLFLQVQNILKHVSTEKPEEDSLSKEEAVSENDPEVENSEMTADGQDEDSGESYKDTTVLGINVLDTVQSEIRRYMSLVKYEKLDKELGIMMPEMIDGASIFTTVMKVTANATPEEIFSYDEDGRPRSIVLDTVSQFRYDGYEEEADALQAAFDAVVENMEYNNGLLRKQFIDTFHIAENALSQTAINHKVSTKDINGHEEKSAVREVSQQDRLLAEDIQQRMSQIEQGLNRAYKDTKNAKKYTKAANKLITLCNDIVNQDEGTRITSTIATLQVTDLQKTVDDLYFAMKDLGLSIPRSLIRASLLSIDVIENNVQIEDQPAFEMFKSIRSYAQQGQYLNKSFFTSLSSLSKKILNRDTNVDFEQELNTQGQLYATLRKAMTFAVRFDPSKVFAMVRSVSGEPLYRFSHYTPGMLMIQEIRQNLRKGLSSSVLYDDYLKDYWEDNALLNHALLDDYLGDNATTPNANRAMMHMFFSNILLSLNGGLKVTENHVLANVDEYGTMGTKQLYEQSYANFANRMVMRDTVMLKDGETKKAVEGNLTIYQRNLTQNEASNTNLQMTGLYFPFRNKTVSLASQTLYSPTLYMKKAVQQEFNRIRREWLKAQERKKAYEEGRDFGRVFNKYNVIKKNGKPVFDDPSFRAFNFTNLDHVFMTGQKFDKSLSKDEQETMKIRDLLVQIAKGEIKDKDGNLIAFDKLSTYTAEGSGLNMSRSLDAHLDRYLRNQFNKHLENLEKLDLIKINKEGGIRKIENKAYSFSPKTINQSTGPVKFGDMYNSLEDFLYEAFMNDLINGTYFNQLIDGDAAIGIKNSTDAFKRNKGLNAAGSNFKEGTIKVAWLDQLRIHMDKDDIMKGQFDSFDDYVNALPEGKEKTALQDMKENDPEAYAKQAKEFSEVVFDGGCFTTLMHRMDMLDEYGQLNESNKQLLIAMNYRSLTDAELAQLKKSGIVLNSAKTVYAGREFYLKLAEHTLNRMDNSMLKDPATGQTTFSDERRAEIETALHSLYAEIYDMRQDMRVLPSTEIHKRELQDRIAQKYKEIHTYWEPQMHRKTLHDIMQSMEIHSVDMLVDTEASKKATPLTVSLDDRTDNYINLNKSALDLDARYKFLQVVTSGVKSEARSSVQSKVLIPADIPSVVEEIKGLALNPDANKEEINKRSEQLNNFFNDYMDSLTEGAKSRYLEFRRLTQDQDHNMEVGKLFDSIREALIKQGSDSNTIKFFETENGEPKFDINNPVIRSMFQYRFFSAYSSNIFEEHVTGSKFIIATSLGYKIIYDKQTNEIIPTYIYKQNPEKYDDPEKYSTRYPGVTVDIDKDGNKIYTVEAIVPMPHFESESHRRLYMEKMTRMFATRIPTEDKRSMISVKIVDWLDSAHANTIIIPQLVHSLAGSDLDVDTLYTHMQAYYLDYNKTAHLYGNYENYDDTDHNIALFKESVNSYAYRNEGEVNGKVKELRQMFKDYPEAFINGIPDEVGILTNTEHIREVLLDDLKTREDINNLKETIKDLRDKHDKAFKDYVALKESNEKDPSNAQWDKQSMLRLQYKGYADQIKEIKSNIDSIYEEREELANGPKLNECLHFFATLKVMSQTNHFATLESFINNYEDPSDIAPLSEEVYQNKNLDTKLAILSNEDVFTKLYKDERADVDVFKFLEKVLDQSIADIANRYNRFSLDGILDSNHNNSVAKMGVAIAASLNKFTALSSIAGLKLKERALIWIVNDKLYDRFGINESERSIKLVGKMLSMIVDAAKNPYPVVFGLNDINLDTTLAMLSLGLPLEMGILINKLPEIEKACQDVTKSGRNADGFYKVKYVSALDKVIKELETETVLAELRNDRGTPKISFTKPVADGNDNPVNVISRSKQEKGTVTPEDLGFKITNSKGGTLSLAAQKLILLRKYREQAKQTSNIKRAGKLINVLKTQKGDFKSLDQVLDSAEELKNNDNIFTNSDVLFEKDDKQTVWSVLIDAMKNADKQASALFLARRPELKMIYNLFKDTFANQEELADMITGHFAFGRMRAELESIDTTGMSERLAKTTKILRDNKLEMFKPEYWYGVVSDATIPTLQEIMKYLDDAHGDNPFVQNIKSSQKRYDGSSIADTTSPKRSFFVAQMSSKAKSSPELKEQLIDGFEELMRSTNAKTRLYARLMAHAEIIRNGFGNQSGNFLKFINPELFKDVNKQVIALKNSLHDIKELGKFFGYKEEDAEEGVRTQMRELYLKLLESTLNSKNSTVRTVKGVRVEENAIEDAELLFGKNFEQVIPTLSNKDVLKITPHNDKDKKATAKGRVATKFIGYGVPGSATDSYRKQAGTLSNTGNYTSDDVVFVSINGVSQNASEKEKEARLKMMRQTALEVKKAVDAGATIITDNASYVASSKYNVGEQNLSNYLQSLNVAYRTVVMNGFSIGVWNYTEKGTDKRFSTIQKNFAGIDDVYSSDSKHLLFNLNDKYSLAQVESSLKPQDLVSANYLSLAARTKMANAFGITENHSEKGSFYFPPIFKTNNGETFILSSIQVDPKETRKLISELFIDEQQRRKPLSGTSATYVKINLEPIKNINLSGFSHKESIAFRNYGSGAIELPKSVAPAPEKDTTGKDVLNQLKKEEKVKPKCN